jgi:chromatin segregation and condensation protein Rec8/ScpA/Scc1 (kleisin family)
VKVELRGQISMIKDLLASQQSFSFNKVFGTEEPLVQALSVFALLDLLSRGVIRVHQAQVFGDILVKRREIKETDRG